MNGLSFQDPVSAWTHGLWGLLALVGGFLLWRRSRGNRVKQLAFLVYSLSMTFCFTASTLFHADRQALFDTLDKIGIYLFIAGSVTPPAVVLLRGGWRWGILAVGWSMAAAGIAVRLSWSQVPTLFSTGLYLGMGWGVFFCFFEMARILSYTAVRPALLGGLLYTVGALLNVVGWPNLWPPLFTAHDLFHLFVMAGSLAHFWFMFAVVAPFDRPRPAPTLLIPPGRLGSLGRDREGCKSRACSPASPGCRVPSTEY